jgi:hypothetical protein
MRPVHYMLSYAKVWSDETFLKTIPMETDFWKDMVLFCKRPPSLLRQEADFKSFRNGVTLSL